MNGAPVDLRTKCPRPTAGSWELSRTLAVQAALSGVRAHIEYARNFERSARVPHCVQASKTQLEHKEP